MKTFIKGFLSETRRQSLRRQQNRLIAIREYAYDARRFLRASSAVRDPRAQGQLAAHLTMDYHRLEKGVALPATRKGFGRDVLDRLMMNVPIYIARFGRDELIATVLGVMDVYRQRQAMVDHVNPRLDAFLADQPADSIRSARECGVIALSHEELFPFSVEAAQTHLMSRRSVRQFTGEPVSLETLRLIAALAQRAPSVCNRQAGRLHFANTRSQIDAILAFQNGNRGFGETLGAVFVVTADLQAFTTLGERNQGFVDGGIFAMQTLHAIHAQHLGGCMLNWSVTSAQDKAMRKAFAIPQTEVIITLIGCGHPIDTPEVAVSPRIATEHVLSRLERC